MRIFKRFKCQFGLSFLMTTLLTFFITGANAQITITQSDMPSTGDSTRRSTNISTFGADYTSSGPDYTWDFTGLFPLTQTVDNYVSVSSVPFLYQLIFIPNVVANLASPIDTFNLIPGLVVADPYIFYKKSSSSYNDVGFAVTINSIPLPIKYDTPDILYKFPMAYGNADSSNSGFQLGVPDLGFAGIERKRVNHVDGWGLLTTPFGTFNTVRLKSQVFETDTIYIDSISFGTTIQRNYTEYKWLGNGFDAPLLQVTEEGLLVTVSYLDSLRDITLDIKKPEIAKSELHISPNPVSGQANISISNPDKGFVTLSVFNISGIRVADLINEKTNEGIKTITFDVSDFSLTSGIYFLRLVSEKEVITKKFVIR